MLGWNHNVRNTPVSRRTTKLHSAISPSMNDQWSGKTLRRFFFMAVPRPSRSSAQLATAPIRAGLRAEAAWVRLLRTKRPVSMLTDLPSSGSGRPTLVRSDRTALFRVWSFGTEIYAQ